MILKMGRGNIGRMKRKENTKGRQHWRVKTRHFPLSLTMFAASIHFLSQTLEH